MDEIFGYFPPVANPPSKQPLLTLLKQARAFGVGVVLATQNPVDLDYKGLANAGTWFIGRLQTERDRNRVLDGLESAAGGGVDRQRMERILSQLGNRVFLMNNVHEDAPVVFETRWVMSYLRGPLTRTQIKTLMGPRSQDGCGFARGRLCRAGRKAVRRRGAAAGPASRSGAVFRAGARRAPGRCDVVVPADASRFRAGSFRRSQSAGGLPARPDPVDRGRGGGGRRGLAEQHGGGVRTR